MDFKPPTLRTDTFLRLQQETKKDERLQILHQIVMKGWPNHKSYVPGDLTPYWNYRDEISTYDGVIVKAHQVIIPSSLSPEMLQKLHGSHQGAESTIRRAREVMFWPGMQAAIRDTCQTCGTCAQYMTQRPAEPMLSHDIPSLPWSKVSLDLFSLDGKDYLVTVDHYSDFFELDALKSTNANTVIQKMKKNFARFGIPKECVTDNGPQFDSHKYAQFAKEYGFTMVKSSPYHSQGNGKAESAVKVAKTVLKKSRYEDPYLALLANRNTPQQSHTYSPAQRLMSRKLRDILPIMSSEMRPSEVPSKVIVSDIARRRKRSKSYTFCSSLIIRGQSFVSIVKINIRSKTSFDILFGQETLNNDKIICINIQLHHQTNNSIFKQALTLNVCVFITKRLSVAFIINHLHKVKCHTQN